MNTEERFWSKVNRCDSYGCWTWTAATDRGGYGFFKGGDRRMLKAHRVSWEMAHGPIPEGLCVCHTCDNPPCVNPAHLWLGTHADNAADKVAKGRIRRGNDHHARLRPEVMARGDRNGARLYPERLSRGETHPRSNAKLTHAEVLAVFCDSRPQETIAAEYGLGQATVSRIKTGKSWPHVTEMARRMVAK